MPEHIASRDGILALNMCIVAKEISNHVQTFMAAPERSWPSYLTVRCQCVAPLALPGVWAIDTGEGITAFLSAETGVPDVHAVIVVERGGYFVLIVSNKGN